MTYNSSPPAIRHITSNQAIISVDSTFGFRDYFLITAVNKRGKWSIDMTDIDIDGTMPLIRKLEVNFSNKIMSAYTLPGNDFRSWWKSIPWHKKILEKKKKPDTEL